VNAILQEIKRMRVSMRLEPAARKIVMTRSFYAELQAEVKRTTMLVEIGKDDPYRNLPTSFSGLPIEIVDVDGSWFELQ
jgi:hypothetical protein